MNATPDDDATGRYVPLPQDMWLLTVPEALTSDLVAWLTARGLMVGPLPFTLAGETVWMTTPTDERMRQSEDVDAE